MAEMHEKLPLQIVSPKSDHLFFSCSLQAKHHLEESGSFSIARAEDESRFRPPQAGASLDVIDEMIRQDEGEQT
jgi:hypothetical protein